MVPKRLIVHAGITVIALGVKKTGYTNLETKNQ